MVGAKGAFSCINFMLTLPCAYLPPIEWFALLHHGDDVRIEVCDNYQKQTYRNRANIATPTGIQALTVPVRHGITALGADTLLSEQGSWRHLHMQALRSAYQMTPYYDYYADELNAFYEPGLYPTLYSLNMALATWMATQMGIERPLLTTTAYSPDTMADLHPKRQTTLIETRPYYQVFSPRTGFIPRLSGIDLLMNMGPESVLLL